MKKKEYIKPASVLIDVHVQYSIAAGSKDGANEWNSREQHADNRFEETDESWEWE